MTGPGIQHERTYGDLLPACVRGEGGRGEGGQILLLV